MTTTTQAKPEKAVPDYAHVVVVPIANPKTAPELLSLALSVVQRDGGRVIALAITLSDSDAEERRDRLDTLEAIVDEHKPKAKEPEASQNDKKKRDQKPHVTVDFVTRTAVNVARGILDQARESGAELIILGVHKSERGGVVLGSIAQAVMSAAISDVLVYRYSDSPMFNRISVPVDGSPAARMAVRMAIVFANSCQGCPVEAVYVRAGGSPYHEARAIIDKTLDDVPGRGVVKSRIVTSRNPAAALLEDPDENQLIIMGFSRQSDFEKWLDGEDKQMRKVLDEAPGPVLLAVRSVEVVTERQRMLRRAVSWLRPTLTDIEREQIMWDATTNAGIDLDYIVLIVISAMLASLGLLLNSTAVIIGAMLVAPLMSPLNAFGVGLSTARLDLTRRSAVAVIVGLVIASLVGVFMGVIVPLETPTTEMMSRVSPTLLDAFVALASGVVGSYATARKDIPAALAGVAIAAALVPPICTFGLQLAFGEWQWALGALLLFLTNIICIAVIATGMFVWLGLRPQNLSETSLRQYISLVIFVLLALPLVLSLVNVSQEAGENQSIEREIRALLDPIAVTQIETDESGDMLTVQARVQSPFTFSAAAVSQLQTQFQQDLNQEIRLELLIEQMALTEPDAEMWAQQLTRNSDFTVVEERIVPNPDAAQDGAAPEATEEAPLSDEDAAP